MSSLASTMQDTSAIPFCVRIGVTGHRELPANPALTELVRHAIRRIGEVAPSSRHTPLRLCVISPLAEGADRLVAAEVLREPGATLEVPLPLPRDDYETDFATEESKSEFRDLLARATEIVILPPAETRAEAYERVGHYVVDRCDVLIALWDGEPSRGQGGTADIVARARERCVPLIWIATDPPHEVAEDLAGGIATEAFRYLDAYNSAPIDPQRLARVVGYAEQQAVDLATQSEEAGLGRQFVQPFCEWILPYYVRADALALRFQRLFYALGDALFYIGAAAVAVAGVTAVLGERLKPPITWLLPGVEILLMLMVLFILLIGRQLKLHERWISSRFLAERFRSALFLALVSADGSRESNQEVDLLEQASEEWLRRAYDEVWGLRPRSHVTTPPLEGLKRLLATAWIEDQLRYQRKTSHRHEKRHKRLTTITVAIFAATLIAALLHGMGLGESPVVAAGHEEAGAGAISWSALFVYLSIALPALAGALGAIGEQREYLRNSHRSEQMARSLMAVKRRMEGATSMARARTIAEEAEGIMLEETRDWFSVMRFRDFELHV